MSKIWQYGQIDAHNLPKGAFLSMDLQRKRMQALRDNPKYREAIEKAQKMAGYDDKLLRILGNQKKDRSAAESLMKQSAKAEKLTEGKKDEQTVSRVLFGDSR